MVLQVTYSELKRQESRDEIMAEPISSIGTKAGNFGQFNEHFRAISLLGAKEIRSEIEFTADLIGLTYDQFMETMPTLKELLK